MSLLQFLFDFPESVDFAVADEAARSEVERLHPCRFGAHDRKSVESEVCIIADLLETALIRSPEEGTVKAGLNQF